MNSDKHSHSHSHSHSVQQKRLKDIRYPLLYEASEYIQDDFWKNMLIDLSRGRYPKKVTLDGTTIFAGNKRNQLNYFYSNKTAQEIATELIPLLRTHLNLLSSNDIKQQSDQIDDQFNEFHNRTTENCWKKIKNKKMKHTLLIEYCLRKKQELNLGWKQARQLMKLVDNALHLFHTHTSNDIIMENGMIEDVEDIVFENGVFTNIRYNQFQFSSDDEEEEDNSHTINDTWINYIKSLTDEL